MSAPTREDAEIVSEWPVAGVILAGGQGRRLQGADKGLINLDGTTLLERAIERAAVQTSRIVVSFNGDAGSLPAIELPIIADQFPGCPGPLAGVQAALAYMDRATPKIDWLASFAVDTPWFPLDFVTRCVDALRAEGTELAVASSGGQMHPVFALWPISCLGALSEALQTGARGAGQFIHGYRVSRVSWSTKPFDPFLNINTPKDLDAARILAKTRSSRD